MLIYLDYNATAPLRAEVRAKLLEVLDETGNASSVHHFGRRARLHVEEARAALAACAGAMAEEVIFTAGGTEANNLALRGVPTASLLTSAIEHESVLRAAPSATRLPVTKDGVIDLDAARALIAAAPKPALVSVMQVNNETGVLQPIAALAEICKAHGAWLHVDAVQALGRVPLAAEAHMLSLSAHKVGGPQGVGALIVREGVPLAALQYGGGQERGLRAGTENVAGIAAFGLAAKLAVDEMAVFQARSTLREAFEAELRAVPGTLIYGESAPRVANTTCVAHPALSAAQLVIALDLAGVAVSSGSACSSGKVKPSHVLAAMGYAGASAVRFSFGRETTPESLKKAAEIWTHAVKAAIR